LFQKVKEPCKAKEGGKGHSYRKQRLGLDIRILAIDQIKEDCAHGYRLKSQEACEKDIFLDRRIEETATLFG
jgi:hypothetical protein